MPRITVPGFRAVGSAAASSLRDSSAGTAGTALMPKYAELLRSRDHRDVSASLPRVRGRSNGLASRRAA